MEIRHAAIEDIPQILPLWRELSDMHGEMEPMFRIVENGEEKFAEYLNLILTKDQFKVLVAEEGAGIIAYVIIAISTAPEVFVIRHRMYIQDMMVDRAYRRKGIARALMAEVMKLAKEKEIKKMDMLVAVKNEASNKFWKAMGFEPALSYMTKYLN